MAEEELNEQTDAETPAEGGEAEAPKKAKASKGGKMRLVLFALVISLAGGAGGGAAAFFTAPKALEEELTEEAAEIAPSDTTSAFHDYAYYDFDLPPINLNVARLNRYIKATVTLAMRQDDSEQTVPLLEKRNVELKNWLMTYMAGLTLEEVQGQKNIQRIQREIRDAINEQLWPDRRPRIEQVLFKEFAVQ